jgi:hypothetical protein
MSAATNCACPCPTPEIVTVPGNAGTAGAKGTNGTNGVNAYTTTTLDFNLPGAPGPTGLVNVAVSSWMSIGQIIFISDIPANGTKKGHFQILTIPSGTGITTNWLNYPGDSAGGSLITSGATVSPAGIIFKATPLPTALTGAPGSVLAALALTCGVYSITFELALATLANADELTAFTPGHKFKIRAMDFYVDVPATTAAKAATLSPFISGVAVTGGVLSLTSANCTPTGVKVAGTAVTALNTGTSADTIRITGSAVTTFIQGSGWLTIQIQNMDTADAITSLNDSVTKLITALT